MHFIASLTVVINNRLVSTIHSVKTKFDSKHIGSTCDIVLPLNSLIEYQDGAHDQLVAYVLSEFKPGDPVTVFAAYDGYPRVTIFVGTVFEFKEGTPCTIKCIDYLALLGPTQNVAKYTGSMQTLITNVLNGVYSPSKTKTGVSLLLPTVGIQLSSITFRSMSPWAILEYIKKGIGLNIALQGNSLYVNVASNTQDVVYFDSSRNLFACELQQPDTIWQGYRVRAHFLQPNGVDDSLEIGDTEGHLTEVYFYNVSGGLPVYTTLANEALVKVRQRKFSGKVSGYLYPFVKLFDRINYTDVRYPDRSGQYVVTELSHEIDDKGFHQHMTWAYLLDTINTPNAIG